MAFPADRHINERDVAEFGEAEGVCLRLPALNRPRQTATYRQ